jgi:hypothetical protein
MHLRRRAAVFVLALTLAAPWVAAAEPRPVLCGAGERPVLNIPEMLSHAWSFLTRLWETTGSEPDPLGSPTTDEGLRIDPLGEPSTDAGLRGDPLG